LKAEVEKIKKIQKHIEDVQFYKNKSLFDNALSEIENALILSPQSIPFQLEKAEILIELRKYSEAAKISGDILKNVNSNNSDAMYVRGKAFFYQGLSSESSSLLLTALQYDPDNLKCLQFRKKVQMIENLKKEGNELFQKGSLKEAYEKYTEAINVDALASSVNSQIYCNRSAVAMKMGDYKLAEKDATTAIDLNPQYTKAYQRRAAAYEKQEKYQESVYDLNKAKELDPSANVDSQLRDLQKKAKQQKRKDYYKILGIEKNATQEEIEKAYKKGCALNHPDRFVDDDEKKEATNKFQDIGEAYSILGDENKRKQFDRGADLNDINSGMGGFPGGMGGVDINDLFSMFGGGGMGGGGGGFSFDFGGHGGHRSSGSSRKGGNRKRYY
jgi:DnaJ homolog subfamily C member 7